MKQLEVRRRWILALLVALLLPVLAACGGQTPGGTTAAPTAASGGEAAAPTTAAAPTAAEAPTAEAAAPTAGTSEQPAGDNILRIADITWPDSLDPQKASFANEIAILQQNYEGLTRFDKDLKTVPAAAEKWEYNADATQVTFTLRDGL